MKIKLRYWLSHVGIEPTSYIPDSPESPNATYRFQKKPVTWAKRTLGGVWFLSLVVLSFTDFVWFL